MQKRPLEYLTFIRRALKKNLFPVKIEFTWFLWGWPIIFTTKRGPEKCLRWSSFTSAPHKHLWTVPNMWEGLVSVRLQICFLFTDQRNSMLREEKEEKQNSHIYISPSPAVLSASFSNSFHYSPSSRIPKTVYKRTLFLCYHLISCLARLAFIFTERIF